MALFGTPSPEGCVILFLNSKPRKCHASILCRMPIQYALSPFPPLSLPHRHVSYPVQNTNFQLPHYMDWPFLAVGENHNTWSAMTCDHRSWPPSTRARILWKPQIQRGAPASCCTVLGCMTQPPQRRFPMCLEFQQLFFTLYVTVLKVIRHVRPVGAGCVANLSEVQYLDDDDDGPRTCVVRRRGRRQATL